ncbi:MAG: metallophosphoesterase [Phocaeicola sp.]
MRFILIAIGIILLPDLYIWNTFFRNSAMTWKLLYWVPLLVLVISFLFAFVGGVGQILSTRIFFFLLIGLSLPKFFFAIISILGKGVAHFVPSVMGGFHVAGAIVAAITLAGAIYGSTIGWKKLTVKEVTITSSRIPKAFDGYRMVQLSDLHIGTYQSSPESINQLVEMVNSLNPDVLFFTGDLVNIAPEELNPFMDVLSQFKTKDGLYSIMGNHDYCTYGFNNTALKSKRNTLDLQERQRTMGWDLLLNEHRTIRRGEDSLVIVGVENDGAPPFPAYGDLKKALKGVSAESYQIVLSHDPSHWRREVLPESNIDLMLAGHTHSMQFRIGNFSPAKWTHREWGGFYHEGEQMLYINTGTGSNFPFRLGAWPEITLLTLRSN